MKKFSVFRILRKKAKKVFQFYTNFANKAKKNTDKGLKKFLQPPSKKDD